MITAETFIVGTFENGMNAEWPNHRQCENMNEAAHWFCDVNASLKRMIAAQEDKNPIVCYTAIGTITTSKGTMKMIEFTQLQGL